MHTQDVKNEKSSKVVIIDKRRIIVLCVFVVVVLAVVFYFVGRDATVDKVLFTEFLLFKNTGYSEEEWEQRSDSYKPHTKFTIHNGSVYALDEIISYMPTDEYVTIEKPAGSEYLLYCSGITWGKKNWFGQVKLEDTVDSGMNIYTPHGWCRSIELINITKDGNTMSDKVISGNGAYEITYLACLQYIGTFETDLDFYENVYHFKFTLV